MEILYDNMYNIPSIDKRMVRQFIKQTKSLGCFVGKPQKSTQKTPLARYKPASWRLRSDLHENEAHALQVLDILLEEGTRNFKQPGFFLQSAGQHVS